METFRCAAMLAALATALAAPHVAAQNFRTAVGYGGGGIWVSPLNAGVSHSHELRLEPGWILDGQLDYWMGGGRFGLRLHGAYTRRRFELPDRAIELNTWFADGALLLRLLPPAPQRTVAPFLALGGGVVKYSLGRGPSVTIEEANATYPGDAQTRLAGLVGLGLDIGTGLEIGETPLGFRFEVADHVARRSPFVPLGGGQFQPVHNVRVTLSVISLVDQLF